MSAEITEEKDVMSGPEAEEFIEELKKVFSIVRLLDKDNFEHMERHYNEHGEKVAGSLSASKPSFGTLKSISSLIPKP